MKKRLRLIITLLVVIVIAVLIAVPLLRPSPLKVEIARAERGALQVTVNAEGKTRVRDRFTVTAPVAGLLKRIELRRGDAVGGGQTLAIIEPAPWGSLPSSEQDQNTTVQSAIVRAPVGGRVLRVLEESERVVAAGTPLLELSNTSKLEVLVDVLSTDAVKIRPGARVLIEGWGGAQPLQARVRLIEPSAFTKISALGVEEQRVNVIADFVGDAGSLGDGFRVEARIVTWERGDVLKVPLSALFRRGQSWSVFVVEEGRARRRDVEAGERNSSEVEIKSGIEKGTQVILHPSNQLTDGALVETQSGG